MKAEWAAATPSLQASWSSEFRWATRSLHGCGCARKAQRDIQWMIENHYNEIDSEYVIDEGGMGSRDALAPGKLVFGISVGDKIVTWVRLRAKGTAGHSVDDRESLQRNRL